jgi:hypothetical protein
MEVVVLAECLTACTSCIFCILGGTCLVFVLVTHLNHLAVNNLDLCNYEHAPHPNFN